MAHLGYSRGNVMSRLQLWLGVEDGTCLAGGRLWSVVGIICLRGTSGSRNGVGAVTSIGTVWKLLTFWEHDKTSRRTSGHLSLHEYNIVMPETALWVPSLRWPPRLKTGSGCL